MALKKLVTFDRLTFHVILSTTRKVKNSFEKRFSRNNKIRNKKRRGKNETEKNNSYTLNINKCNSKQYLGSCSSGSEVTMYTPTEEYAARI